MLFKNAVNTPKHVRHLWLTNDFLQKGLFIVITCLLFAAKASATDGTVEWAGQAGGATADEAAGIAVDPHGNIYVTGYFTGTADIDPAPPTLELTAVGLRDIFVIKLDNARNLVWARQLSGPDDEEGSSIAIDTAGNVYVTGYFTNTVDFDSGTGIANLTAVGSRDIFVAKLDIQGNFVDAWRIGGADVEFAYSIAVDSVNNVYLAGYFYGTVDFDSRFTPLPLSSYGLADAFVAKYDDIGHCVWARQMGGMSNQIVYSIAVDDGGNALATGYFENTADFDGGLETFALTAAKQDIFVAKLDVEGGLVWAKQFGGSEDEHGSSVAVDGAGDVIVTGGFKGAVDFDAGPQSFNLSALNEDVFVTKMDPDGGFIWARQFGGSEDDEGIALVADYGGNVYVTGYFDGLAEFGVGSVLNVFNTFGNWDVFVIKLDTAGNSVWARQMGGTSYDQSTSIAIDPRGHVYTTGYFYGSFNSDVGNALAAAGLEDVFMMSIETERSDPGHEYQSPDANHDFVIGLSELLRVVQLYNSLGYHCAEIETDTEDGYVPGPGANYTGYHYGSDYNPADWIISLSELLRQIQFYNALGYRYCPAENTEDDFCPGLP